MVEALFNTIVAIPIPEPEDVKVKTIDGEHPHYLEIHSVGAGIKEIDPNLKAGDFVFASGNLDYRVIGGQKYFTLNLPQLRFKVSKDLLWDNYAEKNSDIQIVSP